jgi:hypothetical protein
MPSCAAAIYRAPRTRWPPVRRRPHRRRRSPCPRTGTPAPIPKRLIRDVDRPAGVPEITEVPNQRGPERWRQHTGPRGRRGTSFFQARGMPGRLSRYASSIQPGRGRRKQGRVWPRCNPTKVMIAGEGYVGLPLSCAQPRLGGVSSRQLHAALSKTDATSAERFSEDPGN